MRERYVQELGRGEDRLIEIAGEDRTVREELGVTREQIRRETAALDFDAAP